MDPEPLTLNLIQNDYFFSDARNLIQTKLCINNYLMVPYTTEPFEIKFDFIVLPKLIRRVLPYNYYTNISVLAVIASIRSSSVQPVWHSNQ
jgi:hypothetical protein